MDAYVWFGGGAILVDPWGIDRWGLRFELRDLGCGLDMDLCACLRHLTSNFSRGFVDFSRFVGVSHNPYYGIME